MDRALLTARPLQPARVGEPEDGAATEGGRGETEGGRKEDEGDGEGDGGIEDEEVSGVGYTGSDWGRIMIC